MLLLVLNIAAASVAPGGVTGSVEVSGYVPSSCRAGDAAVIENVVSSDPGSGCAVTATALTIESDQAPGETRLLRVTITPR